jgi:6-phosphogluconolactonase
MVYKLDAGGAKLTPNDPPFGSANPGSGPRHIAFGRGGGFVYVNNEMKSTVTTYGYDRARGALKEVQTLSTLPEGFDGSKNSTAEIAVHPSGRFVYVSNRGHDSIAVYRVDGRTGKLTDAGHQSTQGKTPRNFAIAPGGRFLVAANQGTDNVVVFRVEEGSGALAPTGTVAPVPTPVCVTFVPQ